MVDRKKQLVKKGMKMMEKKRVMLLMLVMLLVTTVTFGCSDPVNEVADVPEESIESADEVAGDEPTTEYDVQGVLTSASGYVGEIVLDVVLAGDELVDIKVVEQSETENLGDVAIDAMIAKILDAQSTDVDVASGATASSRGVIEAVAKVTGQVIAQAEEPEDPAAKYDLATYEPEGILVSGKGFQNRYDIVLDVIFNENEITEIRVIEHNETRGFGDGALRAVPERIINQQATEVDVQSGATWTSKAAMKIVEQAVEQAGVNLSQREGVEEAAPAASSSGGGT